MGKISGPSDVRPLNSITPYVLTRAHNPQTITPSKDFAAHHKIVRGASGDFQLPELTF